MTQNEFRELCKEKVARLIDRPLRDAKIQIDYHFDERPTIRYDITEYIIPEEESDMTIERAIEIMNKLKLGIYPIETPEAAERAIKALEYEKQIRDCDSCINHTDNGCAVWECQFEPKEVTENETTLDK